MMLFPGSSVTKPQGKTGKPSREALARGRALRRELLTSESIRDIGPPPPIINPRRRKKAIASLESFLTSYFPKAFPLAFSDDHRKAIRILETVCNDGGLYALGMPRGFGKTTICTRAALWALLTGRRKYVAIIGATESKARKILKHMKGWICFNRELYADFPNEIHGLPQLKGQNKRAAGQICNGEHTLPSLLASEIVFPTAAHNPISGVMVSTCGLTGDIRGLLHDRADGTVIRPDLIILDDPQTKESAKSPLQTNGREEIIYGDVLGLAGPEEEIAAVMPCTVIQRDDLADRMLRNEQWQSTRGKMLYAMPAAMPLWDENIQIRNEGLRVDHSREAGDKHYRDNRAAMDAGAIVGWPGRKSSKQGDKADISALQHAMYLYYRNPKAFAAEYQNEPEDEAASAAAPTFAGLTSKLTRLPRGVVPNWAHWLTVGIDQQDKFLFYVVLASSPGFTASIVEYGAWPQQSRSYFTRTDAYPTLQSASGSSGIEGALWWGLEQLSEYLFGRAWPRDGGGTVSIGRGLVDSGNGQVTKLIYNFCRQSKYSGLLMPSKGRGIGPAEKPMDDWPKRDGETIRHNYVTRLPGPNRPIVFAEIDTNYWKTFMAGRAASMMGEPGALSIYGERQEQHQLIYDHLAAEKPNDTFGKGRRVWVWKEVPNTENESLDALVMAGVAAHLAGANLENMPAARDQRERAVIPPHLLQRRRS